MNEREELGKREAARKQQAIKRYGETIGSIRFAIEGTELENQDSETYRELQDRYEEEVTQALGSFVHEDRLHAVRALSDGKPSGERRPIHRPGLMA
ncbi:MAG TPA: hypothetical protein VMR59_01175 [Patescibacteria group bacterium]|jgi:hypothetical protein|nr:hypothetical protein [Patescibacteria group bacterium]